MKVKVELYVAGKVFNEVVISIFKMYDKKN